MNEHLVDSSSRAAAASTTMTVEEMAREAGFIDVCILKGELFADSSTDYYAENVGPQLIRFAALVRAQALEDAAVICETCEWPTWAEGVDTREVLATAIRSIK